MTGRVQPLDKRLFGNMKGQSKSRIEAQIVKHGDAACTIVASIDVLLQVWESLTQEDLLGAWDHFRGSDAICVKE